MKHPGLILGSIAFFCMSAFIVDSNFKKEPSQKWVSLFNGKDLTNWQIKIAGYKLGENFGNTFRVANGILSTRYNQYDSFSNKFGAIFFNKKYTNYRLKVEYRFVGELTRGAPTWGFRDGGIQYHCQSPESIVLNQSFPVCLEYNLHGGNGKDERPVGQICTPGTKIDINGKQSGSFCTDPFVKKTFHGDQWVTAEIEIRNGIIRHFVNGEEIIQYSNPKLDSSHAVAKTLIKNGNTKLTEGYISLQSNSHPMDFRKIEILEY